MAPAHHQSDSSHNVVLEEKIKCNIVEENILTHNVSLTLQNNTKVNHITMIIVWHANVVCTVKLISVNTYSFEIT